MTSLDASSVGQVDGFFGPEELERAAAQVLSEEVYGFVAGGADDERTLAANLSALRECVLLPRILARSATPRLTISVAGVDLEAPLLVAPMGMQRLIHADGELATAAVARRAGVGFVLATGSSVALEDVASVAGPARWFQLYLMRDRAMSADLVQRAIAADYRAIVLTADVPVVGTRPRDHRSQFKAPDGLRNANFEPYGSVDAAHHSYIGLIESDLGWEDVEWLVDVCAGVPVIVKGLLRADDARHALDHGAAGVVVSNHGGRQLGRAPASIDALDAIVDEVQGRAAVLFDSGVRRAADAITAIGRGADAVLLGRLTMWSLAVGGEAGVYKMLTQFQDQLRRTMTLLGVSSLGELGEVVGRKSNRRTM